MVPTLLELHRTGIGRNGTCSKFTCATFSRQLSRLVRPRKLARLVGNDMHIGPVDLWGHVFAGFSLPTLAAHHHPSCEKYEAHTSYTADDTASNSTGINALRP